MTFHPRERRSSTSRSIPGVDRREFLRRSALAAFAVPSAGALLAACGSDGAGNGTDSPAKVALSRPDRPVTLPIVGDPIADGLQPESGTLKIYNYADYLNPDTLTKFEEQYGVETEVTTFTTMDEAVKKLRSSGVEFDVFFPTTDRIGQLVAGGLLQPLNATYVDHLENFWPRLQDPFYDRGSRYTVPYTVFTTGIGYRSDKIEEPPDAYDDPYAIFWDTRYRGDVWVLDDDREILSMALVRQGEFDINTEDATLLDTALDDLLELLDAVNVKVGIEAYAKLPEGAAFVHQAWSGDLVNAQYYLPENGDVSTLGFWYPADGRGVIGSDTIAIPTAAKHPVLAHHFLNFLLSEEGALDNFSWLGYQPGLTSLDPDTLVADGYVPENLASAVVRETDLDVGVQILQLSTEGEKTWDNAYAKFLAGAQ